MLRIALDKRRVKHSPLRNICKYICTDTVAAQQSRFSYKVSSTLSFWALSASSIIIIITLLLYFWILCATAQRVLVFKTTKFKARNWCIWIFESISGETRSEHCVSARNDEAEPAVVRKKRRRRYPIRSEREDPVECALVAKAQDHLAARVELAVRRSLFGGGHGGAGGALESGAQAHLSLLLLALLVQWLFPRLRADSLILEYRKNIWLETDDTDIFLTDCTTVVYKCRNSQDKYLSTVFSRVTSKFKSYFDIYQILFFVYWCHVTTRHQPSK